MPMSPRLAAVGRRISGAGASARTSMRSSGASATGRLGKVQNYVMQNKGKSAMMGAAGLGGIGAIKNRRSSGLDKTRGRSTGMYKY